MLDYQEATALLEDEDYDAAMERFTALGDYEDSADKALFCEVRRDPVAYLVKYIQENGTLQHAKYYELRPGWNSADVAFVITTQLDDVTKKNDISLLLIQTSTGTR